MRPGNGAASGKAAATAPRSRSSSTRASAPATAPTCTPTPIPKPSSSGPGSARFTIGDEQFDAVAGQILVCPAEVPHGYKNLGPGLLEAINIHANGKSITTWLPGSTPEAATSQPR